MDDPGLLTPLQVHYVLGEIIQGGLVLETNINEISACGASRPVPLSCFCVLSSADLRTDCLVQAANRNRKASAASSNPLIPSALANPVATGRAFARGGSSDGPRRWLAAMGV